MKKLLGVLITAIMMASGLVAFTMSSANAACPYSGCISTSTSINAPDSVKKDRRAKICVKVRADSGNARPKGKVTLRVDRAKGGYEWSDVRKYNDNRECFKTSRLKRKGNYVVKAVFDKKPGSRWKDSDNRAEFRVRR